jgi:biopolymer transport protein ExbD
MAFGSLSDSRQSQPMAEINMIPLIDVMLVLLVIFIVTAPLLTHAVKVDLPRASSQVNIPKRENVQISIDASGSIYWNGELIQPDALPARMGETARLDTQTELHIRADGDTAYKQVVKVMSDASRAGLTRIGFVTDPRQP